MKDGSEEKSLAHADAAAAVRASSAAKGSIDRNTQLAIDRTVLAAERTYSAWVRTGLASLASGVGARALLTGTLPSWFGGLTGSGLILFSAFCFTAAVWRELTSDTTLPSADFQRLPVALLLTINGFLVVIALAALLGIWLIKA
jgi:putative membrane protein